MLVIFSFLWGLSQLSVDDFVDARLASEGAVLDVMVSACEMSESYDAELVTLGRVLASVFRRVCWSRLLEESLLREKNFMLVVAREMSWEMVKCSAWLYCHLLQEGLFMCATSGCVGG